jgi:hypothetical protein
MFWTFKLGFDVGIFVFYHLVTVWAAFYKYLAIFPQFFGHPEHQLIKPKGVSRLDLFSIIKMFLFITEL